MSAAAAPVVLIGSSVIAAMIITEKYDAMKQTLSDLATIPGGGWVMAVGIALSGACQIVTSAGLTGIRKRARIALAGAGACGIAVALSPVDVAPTFHLLAAGGSAVLFCLWPLLAISRAPFAALTIRPAVATTASLILWAVLGWTVLETGGGDLLGLAERVNFTAEMLWPLVVAIDLRRRGTQVRAGSSGLNGPRTTPTETFTPR
ncbi:MAG: hypothetical protein DI630_25865 [Gordonia sp. (in: high G+C Gram-positive bacteria)]|nr:MAG: hypothetical protein DI630_25865 [Gordonia sp. (in: high G+C Gram-positive bacteria)]